MKTKTVWKTLEITCGEERRRARLLTEWAEKDGKPVLKGIICDNPKLSQEEPYDCSWSCWKLFTGRPEPKAPVKKRAAPARKKAAAKSFTHRTRRQKSRRR